jgi:hypothetical protein
VLVCNWSHSVRQNHLYVKMLFNRDSTIQSTSRRFCADYKSENAVPCQPSGRRVIPSERPAIQSYKRPDDVSYRPDATQTKASSVRTTWIPVQTLLYIEKLLFQLASIRAFQQPVRTTLSVRPSFRFSFQNQLWEDCYNRPDDVDFHLDALLIKASSQFKLNRPDARSTGMEIACSRSPVRTAILLVWTREAFIRKLLAADVRPYGIFGRPNGRMSAISNFLIKASRVQTMKDFQRKSRNFWSHSCPSGRPMTTVRMAPNFNKPDAHLSHQPINKGPCAWELQEFGIEFH